MITYELFKAVDDYLFENQEITDKQVKDYARSCIDYARSCMELETEFSYSRGGRNYTTMDTDTLGTISICAKNVNLFRKILALSIRLAQVDPNKNSVKNWVNHLCYCNSIIYKCR